MLRDVVAIIGTEVHPLALGTISEIVGGDRSDGGLPRFEFAVCAARPGPRRGAGGLLVDVTHGLDRAATADLVAIPGWDPDLESVPDEVIDALRAAVDRGARLLALEPDVEIDVDELYIEDGPIVTNAGTAAGIDACLYVVSRELGDEVAHEFARRMVPARCRKDDDTDEAEGDDGGLDSDAGNAPAGSGTGGRSGFVTSLLEWLSIPF